VIAGRQHGFEQQRHRQADAPAGELAKQDRKFSRQPRQLNAPARLVFTHAESLHTIRE